MKQASGRTTEIRPEAVLILGPTGSGKTPLGDMLEKKGLWGRRCFHFDFGAHLRAIARGNRRPGFLSAADRRTVVDSVLTGKLLEKKDFHIAGSILADFLRRKRIRSDDIVVLNGLPRHVAQAELVAGFVEVVCVAHLCCGAGCVMERIRRNTGGDRAGRVDDSVAEVRRRLAIFERRTLPLLDHYASKGVMRARIRVTADMATGNIVKAIERAGIRQARSFL